MKLNSIQIKKWGFACLLITPVIFLYTLHWFYHDSNHQPTGFIQWEHMVYMLTAKEYFTGHAGFLYSWPILNDFQTTTVFFQPQNFVLGYAWKWLQWNPGTIITLFGFIFALLTAKKTIDLFDQILPRTPFKKTLIVLFCWGGGLLSLSGSLLHMIYFKGSLSTITDHMFFLDPANGSWCLNFGRTLIYPLEAYYHFLFMSCILLALQKKFRTCFLLILLLIVSHPYTSIEIIAILLSWLTVEIFYFKNPVIKKTYLFYLGTAFIIYFFYYGIILNHFPIYRAINKANALDWGYKAWHFVPAYAFVWLLSFISIRNIPALKKHCSNSTSRLFLLWGIVTFLLSIHGFALKPVQPIHFTRGYVYAGFFLFGIPALQVLLRKLSGWGWKGYALIITGSILFLFDNISWFGTALLEKNQSGVYFTNAEIQVIDYFKAKKETGIVIGSEKNYELNAGVQLYSSFKGWIPHPFLTLDIQEKRAATDSLLQSGKIRESWKTQNVYLYYDKNDGNLQHQPGQPVYTNDRFEIFKIHSTTVE